MIRFQTAPRAKRGFTMTFLWAILTLALHLSPSIVAPTHAQGSRKDDIVFNSRGIPLAGATIRVCSMPASGQPCTPLAQIFSDSALTQALANPTTTDGLGNYSFYAAPGKYEIEVSGPGITTKQLPNVILPNDPSSPTFSSVSSSGAISAFSLNLTGNLTVNGSTTVVGNLASGTLNLSNQSSPPGAASSGTVNLYTKTTDKRLYYKDDTGTEVGPIASGSGAQTNTPNTFTAPQNFDANFETKGPNPYISLARYGGYGSATNPAPSTTGSISSSSATLTLASAQDFANGQGIVVYKAGPATTLVTPGTPTVTPTYLLNGATTYTYQVIAEDRTGGLTAASAVGQTSTGASTLGANNISFSSCVRTSGVATYTSSVAHNLQSGAQVNISGFNGGVFDSCNGVKTIASVPNSTTFTVNDGPLPNETNTTGTPTVTVIACNTLTFPLGTYSGANTIHYWIYRNGAIAGVAAGIDPWFQDCGTNANTAPSYVPSTPPGSAQPGYLASTIVSGGGTTTLTLANSASTTVSSASVVHDNSANLKAAVQAAYNLGGGTVYISNGMGYVPFNSTLDFTSGLTISGSYSVKIHSNNDFVLINQPWILHGSMEIEGEPHQTGSFSYVNGTQFAGNANPLFLLSEVNGITGVHFNRVVLVVGGIQQTAILTDEGSDGGGIAGLVLDDININGNNGVSRPLVFKGGFDYFINRGNCQNGSGGFTGTACLYMTNSSPAVTGSNPGQVPGRIKVNGLYFANNAIDIDCLPNGFGVSPTDFEFDTTIFESSTAPYVRFNCPSGFFTGITFRDVVEADSIVGFGTPIVDAQNGGNIQAFSWYGGFVNNAAQPFVVSSSGAASSLLVNSPFINPGTGTYTALSGLGISSTGTVASLNNGRFIYALATPAPPGLAVSSGGSVPVGTQSYQLQWVDADGNFSALSTAATVTTSSGNQTVTVTPSGAPGGAVGYVPYRGGAKANVQAFGTCASVIPITVSFVDTSSFLCGQSVGAATGGAAILGPNGVSAPQLRLINNGNIVSTNFPSGLSANRTVSIPDVTGYMPVTSYPNSAYDNATRANGAIGSNWTVTNNGINISSNNFVGTAGANDVAYWNAGLFSPSQFSQVTLTALNGTTEFPGVAVLLSGSGGSTQGYNCIEDTTNIFIQKISGTSNTTLTSASTTGAPGDILRLEAAPGGALTCYRNSVSTLTTTDTSYTSGQPGLFLFGTVSTAKNWSGGNLRPLTHLDLEQDFTRVQHFTQGMALGSETLTASPRGEQSVFLPGALTSTWTGATWIPDKAVTVTRVQVQAKTAPAGCTTGAVVRLSDGTTPVNVTISGAANDSGAIAQNYVAGASLTVAVQTAAAGCTTSPADANVVVQYRMQ